MPGIHSPVFVSTRTRCAGMLEFTIPPSVIKCSVPLGLMYCTIKPTSSVCASSCTTGFLPRESSGRRKYRLRIRSSVTVRDAGAYLRAASSTSSSKPEAPLALDSAAIISSWFTISYFLSGSGTRRKAAINSAMYWAQAASISLPHASVAVLG